MTSATFTRLFSEGSTEILAGRHSTDVPPMAPSERWGPSVCLRPEPELTEAFAALTEEAMEYAGPGHWPTGRPVSSHFTVRVLDRFRDDLHPAHPWTDERMGAVARAAGRTGPVRLRVTGLTLTRASVMASAEPIGSGADDFAAALAEELGPWGFYEASFDRSIWYSNLIHFTGPLAAPEALVQWVARRRALDLGVTEVPAAHLLDWKYDGCQMVPVSLGRSTFASG